MFGVGRALTDVPCRGKVSVDTFPNFGDGVIGRDNVPKSPDREESVCVRRYPVGVRNRVEIEITAETLSPPGKEPNAIPNKLTGNVVPLPRPDK
jgi:hypothetical protein